MSHEQSSTLKSSSSGSGSWASCSSPSSSSCRVPSILVPHNLVNTGNSSSSNNNNNNNNDNDSKQMVDSLCIGSGRFIRAVLIPALIASKFHPAIIQTRGRTFLECCQKELTKKKKGQQEEEQEEEEEQEQDSSKDDNDGSLWLSYEVDTVGYDGSVTTERVPCYGAGSLGSESGREAVMNLLEQMESIPIIGVGVTEAGLASSTSGVMIHLHDILHKCYSLMSCDASNTKSNNNNDEGKNPATKKSRRLICPNPHGRICVICTDNVPGNGRVIRKHMLDIASRLENESAAAGNGGMNDQSFIYFLKNKVSFHDTMVDRITSQRENSNGMVPRCEPVPAKALVVEDLDGDLPLELCTDEMRKQYGIIVRKKTGQLEGDIALKLRVANGTHTAVAHVMALCSLLKTDILSSSNESAVLLMKYLDSFFYSQILPAAEGNYGREETKAVYDDWRRRLCHPHFGLSSFFITQNGAAKGGIRIGPTIRSLMNSNKPVSVSTAFAMAAILRFLTPARSVTTDPENGVYRGWLEGADRATIYAKMNSGMSSCDDSVVMYADGLRYNLEEGWYEFRCTCCIETSSVKGARSLSEVLGEFETTQQPQAYVEAVRAYLIKNDGGNLSDLQENIAMKEKFDDFVKAVSTLYARMIAGDGMIQLLKDMAERDGVYINGLDTDCNVLVDGVSIGGRNDKRPLHYRQSPIPSGSRLLEANIGTDEEIVSSVVFSEVSSALVIDLHTHLLPPSHGSLCLWGIDKLLTYHYLVAEYFMTAPASMTPEAFYALNKKEQADIIWKALFVDRSPVSEACRGVLTTLKAFGLLEQLRNRDLSSIRNFYDAFRNRGLAGAEDFSKMVYTLAGVRYAIMTNIPFDSNEAQHWRPKRKEYPKHYRSALRVDPLLSGDHETIKNALKASGYDTTIEAAKQYLRDWCDTMKPEYMMASTPHNFVLAEEGGNISGVKKTGINEDAMKQPFAFADVRTPGGGCSIDCGPEEDGTASVINENSDFLSEVLMKVCEEKDLPIALKIGAHRGVNPQLLAAGDGVVAFADTGVLARLCTRFPKVRFLATFLSRNNQHEACVLATKFRNLHSYGCWWFCNNPSIIEEITKMRVEMLGTAFTAQHSDARVLDQLIYKWSHSRSVIATVLAKEYGKLVETGWSPTRGEVRRDIERLFGGSYEEFMSKSLK